MIALYKMYVGGCTERSQLDVCDSTNDRDLPSGPTRRTAYIVWAKNKSDNVGTKDKYVTARA